MNRVVGYSATVGRVILAGGADADAGVFSATESRAHVRGRAGVGVASGLVPDSPWLESVPSAPADALEGAPAVLGRTDAIVLMLMFCIFLYITGLDLLRVRHLLELGSALHLLRHDHLVERALGRGAPRPLPEHLGRRGGGSGVGSALLSALIDACEAGPWRQMIAVIGHGDNDA